MKSLYLRMIIIPFLILLTLSCEDKVWDNPNDANTTLDPSEWAPSNLQAQGLSDSQIKLTWIQYKKPVAGFRIKRQVDGGSWTQLADVAADVTQYTDTGLSIGPNYTYRVYAYTASNKSGYSNTAEIYLFETGTVTDIDGNTYQTIKIGSQWWIAENLKVTHYRNGDVIPNVTDNTEWFNLTYGAFCNYGNDESKADTYGSLYNWYAVNDSRNVAPEGWHVSSDEEWKQLEMYLGMSQSEADSILWRGPNEGGKLKETGTTHWNSPNTSATNESGFSALPGGSRRYGGFHGLGGHANFWSSTEGYSNYAWYRELADGNSYVHRSRDYKPYGFSVRCIRD